MQYSSEVIMEKHLARSTAKQTVLIARKRGTPALSREEVSRCINIWASVYGLREAERKPVELALPVRPWLGRKLTRFE